MSFEENDEYFGADRTIIKLQCAKCRSKYADPGSVFCKECRVRILGK